MVNVSVKDLQALAPFRRQTTNLLGTIADACEMLSVASGAWRLEPDPESMYFLQQGKLQMLNPARGRHVLTAGTAAASFPLPIGQDWQLTAVGDTRILKAPARFLELDHALYPEEDEPTLEMAGEDADGEIYVDFFDSLKSGRYELPSLPDLALRIGRTIDDPNTVNDDIARLIQMDPSLTARIMSVVNSAAYHTGEPIRSLQQAVARMGRQQVRNLVFSCIIKSLFQSDSQVLKQRMQRLWAHSAKVAAISFVLAKVTPGLDPNRALLAGLVHDIGAVPILQTARNHPRVADNPQLLDEIILTLKADIGALTLLEWHFDDELITLARQSEHWHRIGLAVPDYLDVVLLAQLHAFIGDQEHPNLPRIDQVPAFHKLALGKLTPRHSIGILDHAAKDIAEVEAILHHG